MVKNEIKINQKSDVKFREKPIYDAVKRAFDVICSLFALIVLSPFFLIVMILIFIDNPGPVFFKQDRVGKNLKHFNMYKFRSMRVDAEEMKAQLMEQNQDNGANFKIENDPRVTKIGKFIRKTSIDELPQLWNIFKGDMSIVGPRPFIPDEQAKLPDDRLLVTPGLSCYWQIMGKNKLSLEKQIELDKKYIEERSVLIDIKIIIKTAFSVFKSENE